MGVTFFLLAAVGCASTTGPAKSPTDSRTSSLVGDKPWTLAFPKDLCTITGQGANAQQGSCEDLGSLKLAPALAQDLGAQVAAMRLDEGPPEDGGTRALLSTSNAEYQINFSQWRAMVPQLRAALLEARIEERESRMRGAPACPAGQVLLDYDSCPSVGGVSDACGAPVQTCGAPLAEGQSCRHHGACSSGKCGWKSGTCEK